MGSAASVDNDVALARIEKAFKSFDFLGTGTIDAAKLSADARSKVDIGATALGSGAVKWLEEVCSNGDSQVGSLLGSCCHPLFSSLTGLGTLNRMTMMTDDGSEMLL